VWKISSGDYNFISRIEKEIHDYSHMEQKQHAFGKNSSLQRKVPM
jgi:hypothetical protein